MCWKECTFFKSHIIGLSYSTSDKICSFTCQQFFYMCILVGVTFAEETIKTLNYKLTQEEVYFLTSVQHWCPSLVASSWLFHSLGLRSPLHLVGRWKKKHGGSIPFSYLHQPASLLPVFHW